jgi:hypothetical protein
MWREEVDEMRWNDVVAMDERVSWSANE